MVKFEPHNYQRFAIEKVLELPAVGLFLDTGLGKTIITLSAVSDLMYDYFDVRKVLVIAPLQVARDVWHREAEKWDHTRRLRLVKVLGSAKQRIEALNTSADIYIINRENVSWLVDQYGMRWPFDMVVVDELSSFRTPKSQRFRALRKVRPLIKRIVGLTATPAPNGLINLWAQIYLLDMGERLGRTLTGFRERYFYPAKWDHQNGRVYEWEPKPGAEDAIFSRLADICVSMKAEDWLELPERIDRVVPVSLPASAREQYERLERKLILHYTDGAGDVVAGTRSVLKNKLLQLSNGAVYDENGNVREIHNAKLEALESVIESANGRPVLVFYTYKHDLNRIRLAFPYARELKTSEDFEDWNAGRIPLLLAHPASTGHGLNLQAGGNIIVWFGLTWDLELYQQANARLHRQGQTQKVIVHHLVAEGTVDEDVMQALQEKADGQEAFLQAVKARIERYSETVISREGGCRL